MATMALMTAVLPHSVMVHIGVLPGKLEMTHRRSGDATIYHQLQGRRPAPGKPNQVCWAASGLNQNQEVKIEAKPGSQGGVYLNDIYGPLTSAKNAVYSGVPKQSPAPGTTVVWRYTVTLYENGKPVPPPDGTIDPEIDIDTDP